jgi:ABC-type xylose transport system permease subunit
MQNRLLSTNTAIRKHGNKKETCIRSKTEFNHPENLTAEIKLTIEERYSPYNGMPNPYLVIANKITQTMLIRTRSKQGRRILQAMEP